MSREFAHMIVCLFGPFSARVRGFSEQTSEQAGNNLLRLEMSYGSKNVRNQTFSKESSLDLASSAGDAARWGT